MKREFMVHQLKGGLQSAAILIGVTAIVSTVTVGGMNYKKAQQEIQVRMANDRNFGTDADIENVLHKHGFNLHWNEDPNLIDIASSGIKNYNLKEK